MPSAGSPSSMSTRPRVCSASASRSADRSRRPSVDDLAGRPAAPSRGRRRRGPSPPRAAAARRTPTRLRVVLERTAGTTQPAPGDGGPGLEAVVLVEPDGALARHDAVAELVVARRRPPRGPRCTRRGGPATTRRRRAGRAGRPRRPGRPRPARDGERRRPPANRSAPAPGGRRAGRAQPRRPRWSSMRLRVAATTDGVASSPGRWGESPQMRAATNAWFARCDQAGDRSGWRHGQGSPC